MVDDLSVKEAVILVHSCVQRPEDEFTHDVIVVPSFQDAIAAVLVNPNIQACILRSGLPLQVEEGAWSVPALPEQYQQYRPGEPDLHRSQRGPGTVLAELRPELDLYLITNMAVETYAAQDNVPPYLLS